MQYIFDGKKEDFIRLAEEQSLKFLSDKKVDLPIYSKDNIFQIGLQRASRGSGFLFDSTLKQKENKLYINGYIIKIKDEAKIKNSLSLKIINVLFWFFLWPFIFVIKIIFKETALHRYSRLNLFMKSYMKCIKVEESFYDYIIREYPQIKQYISEDLKGLSFKFSEKFIIYIDYVNVYINNKKCSIFDQDFETDILSRLFENEIAIVEYKKKRLFRGYFSYRPINSDFKKLLNNKNVERILTLENVIER